MTTTKNPGEGVPKETPSRHSLNTLRDTVAPVLGGARAKTIEHALRTGGYFDRSLLQQVDAAVCAVVEACQSDRERGGVLRALKTSPNDRMRGYAAAVAFAFYQDAPQRCLKELYGIGTLPGTWAQESAQTYVKRLMQRHGTATILPMCEDWVRDESPEARRMIVEALRPRGVWTGYLKDLRENPTPLQAILEAVLDDPSEYVRKAAANCINDVSKDHPDVVCRWARRWHTKTMSAERAWILKRALRTLMKSGHPAALALLGFAASSLRVRWTKHISAHIQPGDAIAIDLEIVNEGKAPAGVHVQVVVEGPGRGRSPRRSTYQIAQLLVQPKMIAEVSKRIPFKHRNSVPKIPGDYRVMLHVNGQIRGEQRFRYE